MLLMLCSRGDTLAACVRAEGGRAVVSRRAVAAAAAGGAIGEAAGALDAAAHCAGPSYNNNVGKLEWARLAPTLSLGRGWQQLTCEHAAHLITRHDSNRANSTHWPVVVGALENKFMKGHVLIRQVADLC